MTRRDQTEHCDNAPDIQPLATSDQSITVLIVDDQPFNRTILKQQLDLLGLNVEMAADGIEALARWQTRHFDLIITDCSMPMMDGYELTQCIRELERKNQTKQIPIIAWTANVRTEERIYCWDAGMNDMLEKSTDLLLLRKKLSLWLDKAGVPVASTR